MEATRQGLRARSGELGRSRQLALRKRSARLGLHASSPPREQVSKVTCFLHQEGEDTRYHPLRTCWGPVFAFCGTSSGFPSIPPALCVVGRLPRWDRGAERGEGGALDVEPQEHSWALAAPPFQPVSLTRLKRGL